MNKILEKLIEDRNVVVIMNFGSRLYGLDTPESDVDYKGIFVPTAEEILLQKCPKSINITPNKAEGVKNTSEDVDIELYSIQYFIELCLKGETVSMDMLHCNPENIVYQKDSLWSFLQGERSRFYSKNLHVLAGYCQKQAAKYGVRGSRIFDAKIVIKFLKKSIVGFKESITMGSVWDKLPTGNHICFIQGGKKGKEEIFYQVCGMKLQKTARIFYCITILENFISKYGQRAKDAAENKGVNWKAVSHAIRYALQLKELFTTNSIKFPLRDRDFILDVKLGKLDFTSVVSPKLDEIISDVRELAESSEFPEKSNRKFWDSFITEYYEYVIKS